MQNRFRKFLHYVVGLTVLASLLILPAHGTAANDPNSRLFTQTGKTVADPFLAYWNDHGGLAQQGYPITEAYDEENADDGNTYSTQYFERARFEYHPEQQDPRYQVLLGLLGVETLKAKYGDTPPNKPTQIVPGGGSRTFPETGKTVTGKFLQYWNTHGALEQQGYPITQAFNELNDADGKTYITQYFERARFEFHPEQANPEYQVLLGLVGNEIYARKQPSGPANPTPTKALGVPTATRTKVAGAPTSTPTPNQPTVTATPSGFWGDLFYTSDIDAIAVWPDTSPYPNKAYFFKDNEYIKYDIPTRKTLATYPQVISTVWIGLPFASVDAVAVWPGDKAYFFKGSNYARFDIATDRTDPGYPVPIAPSWPGMTFASDLDAVAVWPDNSSSRGKAYFFKGDQYIRYDIAQDRADAGYPLPISQGWPGIPWPSNLDDVVVWPNGKAYFFKGSEYASYDIATSTFDPGYPLPITK